MVLEFDLGLLYLQKIRWKIIFHVFSSLHLFQSQLTANLFSETDLETESLAVHWVLVGHGGWSGKPMVANKSTHSNEKKPGCLAYIGDYTTQLYRGFFHKAINKDAGFNQAG